MVAALPAGCGDAKDPEPSAPVTDTSTGPVTFSAGIVTPIFVPICAGCHGAASPANGLNLSTAAVAYAGLVGIASQGCPDKQRVVAGNSAASYLLHKLNYSDPAGGCLVGAKMPLVGALSAAQIDAIKRWIDAGAPNN